MAVLLVTVALSVDGVQFVVELLELIPVVGNVAAFIVNESVNLAAVILFYIWLKCLNVSFVNPKRTLGFFGSFFGEMIPLVNALPCWTGGILFTIATLWAEELAQKELGLKLSVGAHVAVGNPNPVAQPKDFAQNPKGFANNLDNLGPKSFSFNDALSNRKKSARERNDEQGLVA